MIWHGHCAVRLPHCRIRVRGRKALVAPAVRRVLVRHPRDLAGNLVAVLRGPNDPHDQGTASNSNDRPFEFSQRVKMDLDPFSDVSPHRRGNLEGVRRHLLQAAGESPRIAIR